LQWVAVGCSGLQWVAVGCSGLQCVAVGCSTLQRDKSTDPGEVQRAQCSKSREFLKEQ